jgi:hypothetical protein
MTIQSDYHLQQQLKILHPAANVSVNDLSAWRDASPAHQDDTTRVYMVEDYNLFGLDRLYQEWLERLQGERGCWQEGTPLSLIDRKYSTCATR